MTAPWFTAAQLAGLPGLPGSERRTRDALQRLGVRSRQRPGRHGGGGLEYDPAGLPAETRQALMLDRISSAAVVVAAAAPVPDAVAAPAPQVPAVASPTPVAVAARRPPSQAESACADARLILVQQMLELAHIQGTTRAAQLLALQLASEQCSPSLLGAARTANRRARSQAISTRTLYRWLSAYQAGGWWALLPAEQAKEEVMAVADDVAAVLARYHSRDARFRNLSDAAKQVTRELGRDFDTWTALYGRARRALSRVDNIKLIKARHSGSGAKARLPFKRRDTGSLRPLDVAVVDGHTFKAKVRHPDHGGLFAPEVTLVLDAATRMVCGWSVSLSESTIAVGDAMRHAVGNVGVFAIVYSDNGSGETAKVFDCPVDGIMRRLGSDHRTGIPGNPQARGLIERSWRTHMIDAARQFATFQGSDVDDGTLRKVTAELTKEQRALKRAQATGEVIQLNPKAPSWQQFIDQVEKAVNAYNTQHRHRSLPRRGDGKHMTPAEAWAAMFDPALQHKMDPQTLRMSFMPSTLRTAQRGEVTLWNQQYQAPELMDREVDGRQVSVRYDIHDPSFVQIWTVDGRFVCEAKWNANRVDFFPKPVVQMAREKRVHAAVKRREAQIGTALAELQGTVPAGPQALPVPQAPLVVLEQVEQKLEQPLEQVFQAAAPRRPFFDTPSDRYEWLLSHRDDWEAGDQEWVERYVRSEDYAELAEYFAGRGMAWQASGGELFKGAR